MRYIVAVVVVLATTGVALADQTFPAPEIDPGMAGSAMTLLACGLLMLTGRPRKS